MSKYSKVDWANAAALLTLIITLGVGVILLVMALAYECLGFIGMILASVASVWLLTYAVVWANEQ